MGGTKRPRFKRWLFKSFRYGVDNPLSRHLLKRWTKRCPRCGRSAVENLLMNIGGEHVGPLCIRCSLTHSFLSNCIRPFRKIVRLKALEFPLPPMKTAHLALEGIASFGLTQPMTTGAPLNVILEFTGLCNLNCPHCYVQTYRKLSDQKMNELSTEEWLRVMDELAEANVVSLTFSGGEPLMRKDFFNVASYASKRGMRVALATNGTLINRAVAKRLRDTGVGWVEVSVESARKDVHDAIRGEGTFEKTVNAIKCCVKEGLRVGLATTLTKLNKDNVDEIFELARDLGLAFVVFLNFIPAREAAKSKYLDLSPYEREEVLKQIVRLKRTYVALKRVIILQSTHIARVTKEMAENKEEFELGEIGFTRLSMPRKGWILNYVGGCAAGRFLAAITARGDILPCAFLPLRLGNVRENNFIDVWTKSPVLKKMRDRKNWKGRCGQCKYKIVCGGCRARAYAYTGDFLESDPGCILNVDLFDQSGTDL